MKETIWTAWCVPIKLYLQKQIVAFIWPVSVPLFTDFCSGLHVLSRWQHSVTLLLIPRVKVLGGGAWCEVIRPCRLHPHKWINAVTRKVRLLSWRMKLLWKDKFVGACSLTLPHLSYRSVMGQCSKKALGDASLSVSGFPASRTQGNKFPFIPNESASGTLLRQCRADWASR